MNRVEQHSNGIPVLMSAPAAAAGFRALEAERIALIHAPFFTDDFDQKGVAYFQERGFEIVHVSHLMPPIQVPHPNTGSVASPAEIYEWVRSHVPSSARAAGEYLLPATRRGMAAQAAATFGILTGLWIALSPFFVTLQQGGSNANIANLIAGLAVAAFGAVAVASRRGFGGLQFGSLVLGVWVVISSFILDAKFAIATPMFWSNTFAGVVLVLLGLAGLAAAGRATR